MFTLLLYLLFVGCSLSDDASSLRWSQITVASVLERNPTMRNNMHPKQIARLLNAIPPGLRHEYTLSVITVIKGKPTNLCFREFFQNHPDIKVVMEFITANPNEFSNKDMYFVMSGRDELHYKDIRQFVPESDTQHYQSVLETMKQLPVIRMSLDLGGSILEQNKFLIPDSFMLQWDNNKRVRPFVNVFEETRADVEQISLLHPWQQKIPKAYWRGAVTGNAYRMNMIDGWADSAKYYPRAELIKISKKNLDKIDARFTSSFDMEWAQLVEYGVEDMIASATSKSEHLKYKYLISVDGWTAAWERVPWILCSNSLLIKQESSKVEWFYYALKPMVHYYPVRWNMSDLPEAVEFLEKNQDLAKQMVKNANAFAAEFFSREAIRSATIKVLKDYADVQNRNFTEAERQLITSFGLPYHRFSELDRVATQQLLLDFQLARLLVPVTTVLFVVIAMVTFIMFCVQLFPCYKRSKSIRNQLKEVLEAAAAKAGTANTEVITERTEQVSEQTPKQIDSDVLVAKCP